MSHLSSKWAWKQSVGSSVRKVILLFLADAANPDNDWLVWHSFRTIAKACNCSVGSVSKHMRWLVEYQYLVHIHQGSGIRDTNRYRLNWESEQAGESIHGYVDCSGDEQLTRSGDEQLTVHEMNAIADSNCSPDEQTRSRGEQYRSPDEQYCSPDEQTRSSGVDKTVSQPVRGTVKGTVRDGLQVPAEPAGKNESLSTPKSRPVWLAYAATYEQRYGAAPLQNQKINAQICQFVDRVGENDAPLVAMHYLTSNKKWYVEKRHPVGVMLENAEALHNEWATGTTSTSTEAAQLDRRQSNYNVAQDVIDELISEGKL